MKELNRRIMSNLSEGVACGPVSTFAIDGEIVVEDSGHKVYLHAQWISEVGDSVYFEATTVSMYDIYEELNHIMDAESFDRTAFDREVARRDELQDTADVKRIFGDVDIRERYADQYRQLLEMIQEVLEEEEFDIDLFEMDDSEEEWD